jgi:hypothetical protein
VLPFSWYIFWKFVHLAGVAAFLIAHGISVGVAFKLRGERDPARIDALLQLSSSSIGFLHPTIGILVLGGVVGGFLGNWWAFGWIWASIGILVAVYVLIGRSSRTTGGVGVLPYSIVVYSAAAATLLPVALLTAPVYALLLRRHERRDEPSEDRAEEARVLELASLEDRLPMNPFTAVGHVKPGPFRALTIRAVLYLLNYVTRHFLKPGDLVGVKTIHFARWVFLDDRRRVLFASNYDGSLESYMDDFIDKLSWGLNLVFSNGIGYPRTRWLIKDGCRDELAFKHYLRLHQVPTRVWYSAYGRLSAPNVAANERLRQGLHSQLRGDRERDWVQAL